MVNNDKRRKTSKLKATVTMTTTSDASLTLDIKCLCAEVKEMNKEDKKTCN